MLLLLLLCISSSILSETTANSGVVDVMEDARPGTIIIDNLEHRFPILNSGEFNSNYFAIGNPSSPGINHLEIRRHRFDNSVQLVVKDGQNGPDREELCGARETQSDSQMPFCDITLIILHGKRQEPSYGKLTLRILDRNDNSPIFTKRDTTELRIPENIESVDMVGSSATSHSQILHSNNKPTSGNPTTLELPKAHDIDLPENGVKTYRLTTVSGHEIDKALFNLIVNNDNENKIGNSLPVPFLRIVGLLDREKQDEYWFHLLAIDGGNPKRTGTQTIHLVVTDINDNIPKFRKPIFHFPTFISTSDLYGNGAIQEFLKIPETQTPGTPIVTIIADDPDKDLNGQITYRFKESLNGDQNAISMQWFDLETNNGTAILKVAKKMDADDRHGASWSDLNREHSGRLIKLVVEAVDAGSPSLTGSIELLILVENINDNEPVISVQYTQPFQTESEFHNSVKGKIVGCLQENQNEPLTIAHLTVEDGDIIESNSGAISNLLEIHCETNDTRFLLEKVSNLNYADRSDSYGLSTTHFDSPLLFYKMSSLKSIDREAEPWVFVKVICVDQVQVSYALSGYQNIGKLIQSSRLTGSTTVSIKVLDVNDNIPKFASGNYQFSVFETPSLAVNLIKNMFDDQSTVEIGRVSVNDQDEGVNSKVSYRFLSGEIDAFKIDENTGVIRRVGFIDREKVNQMELVVEAKDHGEPSLSSTTVIKVDVLDVNDNPPYWIMSSPNDRDKEIRRSGPEDGVYYFSLNEDAPIGSIVGTISAVDTDGIAESEMIEQIIEKQNPPKLQKTNFGNLLGTLSITYQLENEGDGKIFSINSRNGDIRLNKHLDREIRAHYEFRAFAIDDILKSVKTSQNNAYLINKWQHQYTATATIIITVLDVNDNPPIFETPLNGQEFHIEPGSSMTTAGSTLFTAKAHDPDIGDNSLVRYSLDNNGYGIVEIDSTTGVCYFRETLQYSLMNKLISSNQYAINGRTSNHLTDSNLITSDNLITNRAHELHSFSLSLTIIARDLGTPYSLNNTRTVKLVWTTESQMKSLSISNNDLISSSIFGNFEFLSDNRMTINKLIIPLIIGAILLLLIIFLILFGIFHCRKNSNKQLNTTNKHLLINSAYSSIKLNKALSQNHKNNLNYSNHWCLCINKYSRKLSKQEKVEELKRSIQILENTTNNTIDTTNNKISTNHNTHNNFIVNDYGEFNTRNRDNNEKELMKNRNVQAEVFLKACLPDCVPSVTEGQADQTWTCRNDKTRFKWNEIQSFRPDYFQKHHASNKRLTRTFSDDSVVNVRQLDVGYTALCAYPSSPHNHSQFIPIQPDINFDSYYNEQKTTNHLLFSPYLNRKSQISNSEASNFDNSKVVIHSTVSIPFTPSGLSTGNRVLALGSIIEASSSYYDPIGLTNTCQLSYPSMQTIPSSYDIGQNSNGWIEKYEEFESDKELAALSKLTENSCNNRKPKLADAYAENSFV
ncbi:unnamed protein product [Schistosoma rodhaini]|uniref:Protocadherin-11 X-linked n=1 Tax=Schistosoma rodhaini TaxID=6188 RepID=A0AA85FTQ3_9TREM|nr:unnamed protein product [Schistosoma rodhaini]CAH8566380.1 unnamed protein product [Schistosoma rodhaini]